MVVLGYMEMPEAEVPDEKIWHHAERLKEWFVVVKERRESGLQPVDEAEDSDMTGNAYARELRGA